MENIELASSLFNEYNFKLAKDNIDLLEAHFKRSPGGIHGNKLIFDYLDIIKNKNFEDIDYPVFAEIYARNGKTQAESQFLLNLILQWKQYNKAQTSSIRDMISNLIAGVVITRANELYPQDATKYIDYIKNSNVRTSDLDYNVIENFDNFDIDAITAETQAEMYHSSFDWLNQCFQPHCAIEGSQMICWAGFAGSGKTLGLMAEMLNYAMQGKKVLMYSLGDMGHKDYVVRMGAILSGHPFADSYRDLKGTYEMIKRAVKGNLNVIFAPPGKIKASDIVETAKAHPEIEIYAVDYDKNLCPEEGGSKGDSLYESLGASYDVLSEITSGLHKLLYVASQPKNFAAPDANIEKFDHFQLGESRRKYEVVDMVVCFGYCKTSKLNLGYFNLSKARRGTKRAVPYIRLENGRFKTIPEPVYEYLKGVNNEHITEGEVDQMIVAYQQQYNAIQSSTQQMMQGPQFKAQSNGQQKAAKSPFAK